jgi:hypothetical protein
MKFTLKNAQIQCLNGSTSVSFPKHTSQLINWANQNAQGTRAKVVGQMSDLFPEYQKDSKDISIDNWEFWYLERHPEAIKSATDKIFEQVKNLQKAITFIDRKMVENWVKDLVITKT